MIFVCKGEKFPVKVIILTKWYSPLSRGRGFAFGELAKELSKHRWRGFGCAELAVAGADL
jgi:hypothetical protein